MSIPTDKPETQAIRRTVYFSGHVQGVGFRYTTKRIARDFEVTGYVRNLPDGRVELVAEGTPGELAGLVAQIGAVMKRHIRETKGHEGPATGEFGRFGIE